LNNVLRINPNYPDARDLLNQLEDQQRSSDDILDIDKDPEFIPAMPSSIPGISPLPPRAEAAGKGINSADEIPDDMFGEEEPEPFYRRPLFYVPVVALLVIAALAIVVLKPFAVNSPAPSATAQNTQTSLVETPTGELLSDGQPTEIPTNQIESVATSESAQPNLSETPTSEGISSQATLIPTTQIDTGVTAEVASDLSSISSAFTGFTLVSNGGIEFVDTTLGKALSVSVCTTAGKEMRDLLPKAMDTLAKASTNYASQAQTVAVKMIDCTTNSTLLWIGASTEDAAAFANGTLTDKDFQAKWQPVK